MRDRAALWGGGDDEGRDHLGRRWSGGNAFNIITRPNRSRTNEAAAVSAERGEEFIPHPRVSHPRKEAETLWVVK